MIDNRAHTDTMVCVEKEPLIRGVLFCFEEFIGEKLKIFSLLTFIQN